MATMAAASPLLFPSIPTAQEYAMVGAAAPGSGGYRTASSYGIANGRTLAASVEGRRPASGVGRAAADGGSDDGDDGGGGGGDAGSVTVMLAGACGLWAPLADWRVASVREGVRALPPRTPAGSLPLLGRLAPGRPWWLVAGLGSRGLVYHGWLGRLAAEAVLADSEGGIPAELTAWRGVAAEAAVFEAP
ncbi:hypothetical protein TSOC_002133 [Tetrabaena socialis]|uniref:FAD dependent oxidoreductase domain-containing protein n=1 Tax=Tetrabaena socialis TaxID=47790 RepID=A0A2J8AEZ0_9CHLO|nr:hypothetical protein TSOC_002133 [Tetrabaena socialis]|eukprot:PNH11072.1 hypothetical protein TSOC_002133 [Tetrabaena socialis]